MDGITFLVIEIRILVCSFFPVATKLKTVNISFDDLTQLFSVLKVRKVWFNKCAYNKA